MATNSDWAAAFRRQAESDFAMYAHLVGGAQPLPRCHALHHLQMATEKIAKAYRLVGEPDATPSSISQHQLGNFVEDFFRSPRARERLRLGKHNVKYAKRKLTEAAQTIEALVPRDLLHRNAEYPWEVAGVVRAPTDEDFPDFGSRSPKLVDFLNFLKIAIEEF